MSKVEVDLLGVVLVGLKGFEQMLEDVHREEIDSTVDGGTDKGLRLLHVMQHLPECVVLQCVVLQSV